MRVLHRRLGWIAGFVALAWAATGFVHPIMSWTAPRAAVQAPPPAELAIAGLPDPREALAAAGVSQAVFVRLIEADGRLAWLAGRPDGTRIALDARTLAPAPDAEQARAVMLARHYAALPDASVARVRTITAFSTEYPPINRLLPVTEVRFDTPDGLTLYVDTAADRLASVVNDPRRVMLAVFQNVHTLKFLEPVEPLRIALILGLVGGVLATSLAGAGILLSARGRGVRAWHRLLGWVALPLVMMFTTSGLLHLVVRHNLTPVAPPAAAPFAIAALGPPPGAASPGLTVSALVATAAPQGDATWRAEAGGRGYHSDGASDAERARTIAGAPADAPVTLVTRFGGEYGFANKRLPVHRVETPDGPAFVDLAEGLVAARPKTSALERVEDWTFDTLHKWRFLDPIGRMGRDIATMTGAALIAIMSALGLGILLRRRRKQSPSETPFKTRGEHA
jgi:hypothetical protein